MSQRDDDRGTRPSYYAAATMDWIALASLVLAGALGGALNSVAGGGSFIVFPALVFAGVTPVSANATTTVGLWPASAASAYAYRRELPRDRRLVASLAAASLVGGALGALLLLRTSDATFSLIVPWLIAIAAALFTFGPRLQKRLRERLVPSERPSMRSLVLGALLQLGIATYGGYFGGGMGILMLATFSLIGLTDLHAMNGLKSVLGAVLNGVAIVAFLIAREVQFVPALAVAIGGVVGGFGGASVARRVPPERLRMAVIVFAWAMAAFFAWRAYG